MAGQPGGAERETGHDEADSVSAPLDALLADAGTGPIARWLPGKAGLALAAGLARRPGVVLRRGGGLAAELGRIAVGRSEVELPKKDRRFADAAWSGNPVFHRIAQAYLATAETAEHLVDDADLDWRSDQRIRFLAENLVEAIAPSNNPLTNPAVWKSVLDTGGASLVRGATAFVKDMSAPPRVPRMVDTATLQVGRDLAVTPGAVVFRNPMLELLQYTPQTEQVRSVPLLVVPPTINKYYVADLAPGRSLVEHLVGAGQQVFVISWRNPDETASGWGFDAYGQAILDALDAVEKITGTERSLLLGLCAGGILTAMTVAHLTALGHAERIAGLSLLVTVLDQGKAGTVAALTDRATAEKSVAKSTKQGYLDGAALAEVFAWLRPGDLVWNYVVNNYLQGKPPPSFDILSWNADTTRLTASLHREFIDLSLDNRLADPGSQSMLGTPVDLSTVHTDSYVVAGIADHICPWQSCYRTTALLGGKPRFVLSTSGHIAAIVNPPGNKKAKYRLHDDLPVDAQEWLDASESRSGSWWEDYAAWLGERGGPERAAPATLGGAGFEPLDDAPGRYVLEK